MKLNARAIAAMVLTETIQTAKPLNQVLVQHQQLAIQEQALIQALCYGVMRYYWQFKFITSLLLAKPLANKELMVQHLIYLGLFQLLYMRIPDHAAIFETVAASKQVNKAWAVKLINGVLRTFQRQQTELLAKVAGNLAASTAHPLWLLTKIRQAWPQYEAQIIAANNAHPPMAIRVNLRASSVSSVMAMLTKQGVEPQLILDTVAGLVMAMDSKEDLTKLPEFAAGYYSIQDGAAQLAMQLLELQPQQRVLDACAAPGGKTCHLLEYEPTIKLIALDKYASRAKLIQQNIQRLKLPSPIIKAVDARQIADWWDHLLFDRILLDAPCSATGIIRRQPDIKVLRKEQDIAALSAGQTQLLTSLWPLLKPGGILLYATCSILPEENEQILAQFIASHHDAVPGKIDIQTGIALKIGRQILPGQNSMDGFYYAKLLKQG